MKKKTDAARGGEMPTQRAVKPDGVHWEKAAGAFDSWEVWRKGKLLYAVSTSDHANDLFRSILRQVGRPSFVEVGARVMVNRPGHKWHGLAVIVVRVGDEDMKRAQACVSRTGAIHSSECFVWSDLRALDEQPARLDVITRQHSAFPSFQALLDAPGGYRPSLDVSNPDLLHLAVMYDGAQRSRGDARRAFRYGERAPLSACGEMCAEAVANQFVPGVVKFPLGPYRYFKQGDGTRFIVASEARDSYGRSVDTFAYVPWDGAKSEALAALFAAAPELHALAVRLANCAGPNGANFADVVECASDARGILARIAGK